MSRKGWIDCDNQRVQPAAFFRRPAPRDEEGLSVDTNSARSCHQTLNKCHGVVSLHVGRVRDLSLDVVADAPTHANIDGLPRREDNPAEAERLASRLAKQARIVPPDQYLESA